MIEGQVKNKLAEKWNIDLEDYWIPLSLKSYPKMDVCHFDLDNFIDNVGINNLNKIVGDIYNGKIIKFTEFVSSEIFENLDIKIRAGEDIFYTNENADWVIYITHEQTITFGGNILIEKIKHQWTDWSKYVNLFGK